MYSHSVSTLEFHTHFTFCSRDQDLGYIFYLMKPLIKSCGFTSNWLTFRIIPQIRTRPNLLIAFFVLKIGLHLTDCHPVYCLTSPLQPFSPHSYGLCVPHCGFRTTPVLNIRNLNSSRFKGHLHSIWVQVLTHILVPQFLTCSFPKSALRNLNSTFLLLLTLLKTYWFSDLWPDLLI